MLEPTTRAAVMAFLAHYDTLVIATEHEGQPYVTRAYYVEEPVEDSALTLYGTFITTSRKLANLRRNARVGLFIGPHQPTTWLEATAIARVVEDEQQSRLVRERLGRKSSVAAGFITSVPIVAVELQVSWLRITNLGATPAQIEVVFVAKTTGAG